MHPLVNNLDSMTMSELEAKVADLSKKYFQTANPSLQTQISMVLESYQSALSTKRQAELTKLIDKSDKGLDKLINIG